MSQSPVRHAALLLAAAVASSPAAAAVLEEVIVTAQKREQGAQDVGIAVTALTGDQMRQLGYTNAQQVTALAPGVSTIQPNGEANYAIAIRGVANSDFTTNVESPVALYLDDVYISQMSGAGFMLFDMERVEILRGPQGTLYGRNATGGLAHFITRKPSEEFDGYGQLTWGEHSQFKFEGAIGGSIGEGLEGRLAVSTHYNDGYVTNRFLDEHLNNANDETFRAQLLAHPGENTDVLLNVRVSQQDIRTGFFENVSSIRTGELTPDELNTVLGYNDNDGDVFEGDYDRPGHNRLDTNGMTLTVTHDFEAFTLTSITDRSTVERDYIEDSDASPVPFFNFYLSTDASQWSQELRLNGDTDQLTWLAGFYWLSINIDDANGAETEPFIDPVGDTPAVSGLDNPYSTDTDSWSLFGQVEYAFNDQLKGIAGLRFISDDKRHVYETNAVDYIDGTRKRNGNPTSSPTSPATRASATTPSGRCGSRWSTRRSTNCCCTPATTAA